MRIDIDLATTPMGDVRKLRAMLDIWTGDTPLPLFEHVTPLGGPPSYDVQEAVDRVLSKYTDLSGVAPGQERPPSERTLRYAERERQAQIVAGTGLTPPPAPTVVLDALTALKERSDSGELLAETTSGFDGYVASYAEGIEAPGEAYVVGDTISGLPAGPALDSRGLPWDERIHSSNHELTAAGVWRKRRGVDEALVAQVEAELRAAAPVPTPAVPPPPPLPDAPETPPGGWLPPGAPVPPPPPPSAPMTLASVMPRITAAMAAGTVALPAIAEAAQSLGVATGLPGFQDRPDLLPAFLAAIGLADG